MEKILSLLNKFAAIDGAILEQIRSTIAKTRIFRLKPTAPGPLAILAAIIFVFLVTLPIIIVDYLQDKKYISVNTFEVLFGFYMLVLIAVFIVGPIIVIIKKIRNKDKFF